jgi:hypothetical protein
LAVILLGWSNHDLARLIDPFASHFKKKFEMRAVLVPLLSQAKLSNVPTNLARPLAVSLADFGFRQFRHLALRCSRALAKKELSLPLSRL